MIRPDKIREHVEFLVRLNRADHINVFVDSSDGMDGLRYAIACREIDAHLDDLNIPLTTWVNVCLSAPKDVSTITADRKTFAKAKDCYLVHGSVSHADTQARLIAMGLESPTFVVSSAAWAEDHVLGKPVPFEGVDSCVLIFLWAD